MRMIFIGAGPVGLTMARLFSNVGHKIVYFLSRDEKNRQKADPGGNEAEVFQGRRTGLSGKEG